MITDLTLDDELTVSIHKDSYTASHFPDGISIATQTINLDGEGASGLVWKDIMFSALVPLTADTTYWIVAKSYEVTISSGYGWASDNEQANCTFSIGAYTNNQGGNWASSTSDRFFKVYRSTNIKVGFYNGDPDSGGSLINTEYIAPVPGSDSGTQVVYTTWSATPVGYQKIYVKIDPDNQLTESGTANNKDYNTIAVDCPRILAAETVDDDLNGKIDAYHITFSTFINDSFTETGFDIAGYVGENFDSNGLSNHSDTADDNDIYISFTEGGARDTNIVPEVTYSSTTGQLTDLFNSIPLLDIENSDLAEIDGAAPVIYSALASDDSGNGAGIQAGDTVELSFSESVSGPPTIDASNIDEVLKGTFSWTWKDVNGFVNTSWSGANTILTITLSDGGGAPTVSPGYTVITDTFTFLDASSNCSSHTFVLGGDFGIDGSSPTILSRVTKDRDSDGYLDAIYITFSENVDDSSLDILKFDVSGVSGEAFSSTAEGDTADDNDIYITFTDGTHLTDAQPTLTTQTGAIKDMSGNSLMLIAQACTDGAPPAILTAVASDYNLLEPGVDPDDRVTITFSEDTNKQQIDSGNINSVLNLDNAHTWKDASGVWNSAGDVLTVTFGDEAYQATVSTGDIVTISSTTVQITDSSSNISIDSITVTGAFGGDDITNPLVYSVYPANGAKGVKTGIDLKFIFNERMNIANTTGAITVSAIRNKKGETISGSPISGTYTESYDTDTYRHTFTFSPNNGLSNNYTYKIELKTGITDTIGNHLAYSKYTFTTIMNHKEANTLYSENNKVKIDLEPGTLPRDFYIEMVSDPVGDSSSSKKIKSANNKLYLDDDPFSYPIDGLFVEITAYDSSGEVITSEFKEPVQLTIRYEDDDEDGIVDGTDPPLPEETLGMFRLDEKHKLWVKVYDSHVNSKSDKVVAETTHFSVFALRGSGITDLEDSYAFPVPYKPSEHDGITFTNLSPICTIKIYTLEGELVKRIEHVGGEQETWEDVNLASGVYLYLIQNDKDRRKGKLMVIR